MTFYLVYPEGSALSTGVEGKEGQQVSKPDDVIKDPMVLEFLALGEHAHWFVLIDLKLGKLTHQDLGQMRMYVNYFDRLQRVEGEAPTVGIVLCSEKNDAMVRITLPEDNEQIVTSRYQLYLPTEEQLREELVTERERLEQAPGLAAPGGEEPEDA